QYYVSKKRTSYHLLGNGLVQPITACRLLRRLSTSLQHALFSTVSHRLETFQTSSYKRRTDMTSMACLPIGDDSAAHSEHQSLTRYFPGSNTSSSGIRLASLAQNWPRVRSSRFGKRPTMRSTAACLC